MINYYDFKKSAKGNNQAIGEKNSLHIINSILLGISFSKKMSFIMLNHAIRLRWYLFFFT